MKLKVKPGALLTLAAMLMILEDGDVLPVILAAAIHEAGHLAAVYICGLRAESITAGLGGFSISYRGGSYLADAVIALAGPLTSAVTAALSGAFLKNAAFFTGTNAVFAAINILPISHLDGGRAASSALSLLISPEAAGKAALALDIICLAGLFGAGLFAALSYSNYTLIISAVYLCLMCCKNAKSIVQ